MAVTDHNTIEGALAVEALAPFRVIVGEEVRSSQGEVTGLFLTREIPSALSAVETAIRIKEQGGLVSIPHPFDRFRGSVIDRQALEEIVPYIDIVEVFNSRNVLSRDNQLAVEFANAHGLLGSAVSDAHTSFELGRTYVEISDFDGTAKGFKDSLSGARLVRTRTSPLVHLITTLTKAKRRLIRPS